MTQDNLATREDVVNHPKHYTSHPSGIECIEISRHLSGCLAQAFQYVWRCGQKDDPVQELKKAIWFIDAELSFEYYPFIYFGLFDDKLKKVVTAETSIFKSIAFLNIASAGCEMWDEKTEMLELAKEEINHLIKEYER